MSEGNVIHENFHRNIACSQRQMNTCHTSFSYILSAYNKHRDRERDSFVRDSFVRLNNLERYCIN